MELHQQPGAEDHRVHAQLRVGAVAPLSRHLQADAVAAGVGDPLPDGDGPQGQVGGAVEAHHRVGRSIPEQAPAQHGGRPVKGLLPALEDQQHVPGQVRKVRGHMLRQGQHLGVGKAAHKHDILPLGVIRVNVLQEGVIHIQGNRLGPDAGVNRANHLYLHRGGIVGHIRLVHHGKFHRLPVIRLPLGFNLSVQLIFPA